MDSVTPFDENKCVCRGAPEAAGGAALCKPRRAIKAREEEEEERARQSAPLGGLKSGLFSDFFSDKSQSEKSGFSESIFVTCQKTEG